MPDPLRAFADPTRRALLTELRARDGQTLFELCTRLAQHHGLTSTRQAVSQHLDVLAEAGLLHRQKVGRTIVHHIDLTPLRQALAPWADLLQPDDAHPEESHEDPPDEHPRR
ncbi:ArsR/SmtB family transcription factor [Cellulomonas endophytica]|uniref:ArsR/SmtB family transcription factor n=1 Tax=Cellulomonas endophytica TaxID=2494735 RepID=UPI00101152FC|nr:metalloregulator ArsR/SmtB family transcription factor [Cellulomonas endophytica]